MRNLVHPFFIVIIAMLSSCTGVGQKGTPEAVKKAFQSRYPGENDPDWHIDKNGNYEASFKQEGNHYRADYSPDGQWIETEQNIDEDDLPKAIKEAIKRDYEDEKIDEIEKVESASKGLFYDVEFKIDGEKIDVEYNERGEVIGGT